VLVYVDESRSESALLREILAGLEEEGVPGRVRVVEGPGGTDAVALAHEAAQNSDLEVGLGLDANGAIALHHRRADADQPIFTTAGSAVDGLVARAFGVNAARLVKVQPLRGLRVQSWER